VAAGRQTAAKNAAKRLAPKPAAIATQERKGKAKSKKAPVPKKTMPSTSSEVQVAYSRTPSASEQPPLTRSLAASEMPVVPEKKQQEQRPKQRRRRIEQDDSMEEFLAKCEAATEK
jgi:hypothetical protein